jgi:hypothetical protein
MLSKKLKISMVYNKKIYFVYEIHIYLIEIKK